MQNQTTRVIDAPVEAVFRALVDVEHFVDIHPGKILRVEFLSEQRGGLGTRFRETRLMNGSENVTELEITEFVENERVRFVTPVLHGTIWDTVMTVRPLGDHSGRTELAMELEARAQRMTARIMNTLIKGIVQKAVESDMDELKRFCEAGTA